MPAFTNTGPQLTAQILDEIEVQSGHTIPASFRKFLLHTNGGSPAPSGFSFRRHSGNVDYSLVRAFLSVHGSEHYDLQMFLDIYRTRIPKGLFPIATDTGDNLILMGSSGNQEGKIYFWDHEFESSTGEPPHQDNIYLVAHSLEEFLSGLHDLPASD